MAPDNKQPQWDIYEAVILLDGYLEALQNKKPKLQIIKRVSSELRQMAVKKGIIIDDIYRNENGISYQMKSMESAYKGHTIYTPATKLFKETVEIYQNERKRYEKLLEMAKGMIDTYITPPVSASSPLTESVSNIIVINNEINTTESISPETNSNTSIQEKNFFIYLRDTAKLSEKTCASYVSSIKSAERYATYYNYTSCELFSNDRKKTIATAMELYADLKFMHYNEEQHNRFSAAINKLLESIGASIPEKTTLSIDDTVNKRISNLSESEVDNEIIKVLKKHYQYGYKYDSIRELMRFRQFAETMEVSVPEDDKQLKASILASGIIIGDKVYCNSDSLQQSIKNIVDDIFSLGAEVIYYESLLEHKSEWMSSYNITSEDILKEYLQKNISGCSFSKKFMNKGKRRSEKEAVTGEIKRIWGNRKTESVYNLSDRLPYIPLNNIWRVISGNNQFVIVSEGEYLFIERLHITENEEEDILDFVDTTCKANGFTSLSDIPIGSIEEENYEIHQFAIYNAIYKKVLSSKYYLNGKILTKDKPELDAVTLLKHYIKGRDECTFEEIADKVVELTGGTNRQYAFQALYDDMIRVDNNRFVANRFVNFSIDEIDRVLSGFITDHFRSIQDVTTFAVFPICGQNWNHYLLESYCYKYSKKYSLHVIHFNSKNVGIIAERDFNKNYNEMLAIALARADVKLTSEAIGQYLFSTGYISKRKYAKLDEIAHRSEELRKER